MTTATQLVDTKKAERRKLHFNSLAELKAEIDRLASGEVRTTGNWTLAQAIDHLAAIFEGSLDGIPAKAPWFVRMLAPTFRNRALHKGIDPGIKLSGDMLRVLPPDNVTLDNATARMNRVFQRLDKGEKMQQPSPVFGKMTHEDWSNLHMRHAELHLSFMHPIG